MKNKEKINLEAVIDLTKTPNEIRVRAVDDPWMDFGYWLEVGGFMVRQAAGYREKTIDEMVAYAADYLKRAAEDYKLL